MASELVKPTFENFTPSYATPAKNFSEMNEYGNFVTNLNDEQILDYIFRNSSSLSKDDVNLDISDDVLKGIIKEIEQLHPENIEHELIVSNIVQDPPYKAYNEVVPINEEHINPRFHEPKISEKDQLCISYNQDRLLNTKHTKNLEFTNISVPVIATPTLNSPFIIIPISSNLRRESPITYPCDFCGAVFKNRQHLKRHRYERHELPRNEYAHKCHKCDKHYKRREHLLLHERSKHSNVCPYVCQKCGKGFFRKYHLTRHVEVHLQRNRSETICAGCGKVFAKRGNLRRHASAGCVGTNKR